MSVLWLAGWEGETTCIWLLDKSFSTKQMDRTAKSLCFSVTWMRWNLHTTSRVWSACSLAQNTQLFLEDTNSECSLRVWSHASAPGGSCWCASLNWSESGNRGKSHSFTGVFSVVPPRLHMLLMFSHPRPISSSQISLFWMGLLESMNTMISVFPILVLGLMLRSASAKHRAETFTEPSKRTCT